MSVLVRNNVHVGGAGEEVMVFAHGYGCDQNMWRYVAPAFEKQFRVVLFDHVGSGASDLAAYDPEKYANLSGYANDVVELCEELKLQRSIFVGHSVGAIIGVLATIKAPELFKKLILVGPSPRYVDDGDYVGGFSASQIDELLEFLVNNHMGWSAAIAPVIMGNVDRPELGEELTGSFCRMDPAIAAQFARATFLSDNRADLAKVMTPSLILQCSDDVIAPTPVGEYVHGQIRDSTFVQLRATGHCPNLSAPDEVIEAIRAFI